MVIDLYGLDATEVLEKFPTLYQWIVEKVKPSRDVNKDKDLREKWWLHRRNNEDMRNSLAGMQMYVATVMTAKHRFFTKISGDILPDQMIVAIALEGYAELGILSSRLHICWALAVGGTLEDRPRYNKNVCFETFPFPDLAKQQSAIIGEQAEKIDKHRKQQKEQYPKLTLTNIYNVLEKLRKDEVLNQKEQLINQQGLVSILRELHDELDRQVFAAYGWPDLADALVGKAGATTPLPDKSDEQAHAEEELLSRLVALNHERAAEEKLGKVRWLRPDYQNPDTKVEEKQEQVDMALADTPTMQKATVSKATTKATWPKVLSEQIAAVIELLANPVTCEQIADNFKRKPIKQVRPVLEALEALGRAQLSGDTWELN